MGTDRRPIALLTARGDILVGPDNGLLVPAGERLGGIVEARELENRSWMLPVMSTTFHGRDVFAPVAAHLALGEPFEAAGAAIDADSLVRLDVPATSVRPGRIDTAVVYVDSFGNVRLAAAAADLVAAFGDTMGAPELVLELEPEPGSEDARAIPLEWRRTFGEVAPGSVLLYVDSAGDAAIAVSNGNAAKSFGLTSGRGIGIRRA